MCVKEAIEKVIEDINEYPFIFRNETDIQARLYYKLCKELDDWEPKYETNYKHLNMNKVHCEYYGGGNQSIDIVVLDKNDIQNVENRDMKNRDGKPITIAHAIEIKTECGKSGKNLQNSPERDIKKLKNIRKQNRKCNLHFIYIVRWDTNPKKQEEIKKVVDYLKKQCNNDIIFYSNAPNKYFLEE